MQKPKNTTNPIGVAISQLLKIGPREDYHRDCLQKLQEKKSRTVDKLRAAISRIKDAHGIKEEEIALLEHLKLPLEALQQEIPPPIPEDMVRRVFWRQGPMMNLSQLAGVGSGKSVIVQQTYDYDICQERMFLVEYKKGPSVEGGKAVPLPKRKPS